MSRIDEALKRASQSPQATAGTGRISDASLRPVDGMLLDDYPVEAGHVTPDWSAGADLRSAPARAILDKTGTAAGPDARYGLMQNPRLVLSAGQDAVFCEQYRRLAATLHEAQVARGLKTLVVTSAVPKEGKTLTAINLALTLSNSYERRVLLIDADLRMPSVSDALGIPDREGLTEALRADRLELPTIAVSPLLDILPSGRVEREPLAGLSSGRMKSLLEVAAARYDWVILDTPPVALLSDAQLVAGLTQAVVFVIRAGSTPFPVVSKALDALGRDLVIGTVLNGADGTTDSAAYYYSHYYSKRS